MIRLGADLATVSRSRDWQVSYGRDVGYQLHLTRTPLPARVGLALVPCFHGERTQRLLARVPLGRGRRDGDEPKWAHSALFALLGVEEAVTFRLERATEHLLTVPLTHEQGQRLAPGLDPGRHRDLVAEQPGSP